mmetsp:Transcript_70813/g.218964  ORF Transcript_70813/g.218964 Transcript_70813/m.218964 type:complete len:110 (-) Transcript_70813:14-343(-)
MLDDRGAEPLFFDDARWENFPAVGAALKEVAEKEECFTIVVCRELCVWAVGVGMRGRCRRTAAKAALAATLALQADEDGDPQDLSSLPLFADFVEDARLQALGGADPMG